jgi:hypothetical protein
VRSSRWSEEIGDSRLKERSDAIDVPRKDADIILL